MLEIKRLWVPFCYSFVVNKTPPIIRLISVWFFGWKRMKKPDWKPQNPWFYGAFPVCRNYTVRAYIHQQSLIQRGSAQGCAGTSRTCRCKYHNEHLRSCYKGSQADFRKTARQSGRSRIKKLSLIFSREGKSKGKGQARGRENAENTSVFQGSGLRIR